MKTWKAMTVACRTVKSGRFASRGKCRAFVRQLVRANPPGVLFV